MPVLNPRGQAASSNSEHLFNKMTKQIKNYLNVTVTLLLALILFQGCNSTPEIGIQSGKDVFVFNDYEPLKEKPVRVFTYRPEGDITKMPILFVMHGTLRNADTYRDNWIELAEKYDLLIITPEFSDEDFPGSRGYNLGGMFDSEGNPVEEQYWAYSLIEPIFDRVLELANSEQETYDIFGHSAGAQFTHRLLLFKENLRANYVISSNAGWYTMPDFEIEFPYGLKNTALNEESLKQRLEHTMLIQLGEEDNNPNHRYLRTSPEAMKQGEHRFERGHKFLKEAENLSRQNGAGLQWFIRTVPGVGHNNAEMAVDIARYLYEN